VAGLTAAAATALFEVGDAERVAVVDEFAATAAADGVTPAVATARAGEELEEALTAAAALGIAVHRFPPINVIEAPAGRDMLKESSTSARKEKKSYQTSGREIKGTKAIK
jgi:hypothetical protein